MSSRRISSTQAPIPMPPPRLHGRAHITWVHPGGDNDPPPRVWKHDPVSRSSRRAGGQGREHTWLRNDKKLNVGLTSLTRSAATAFFLAASTAMPALMRALAARGADR